MSRPRPWEKLTDQQREAAIRPLLSQGLAISTISWKTGAKPAAVQKVIAAIRKADEAAAPPAAEPVAPPAPAPAATGWTPERTELLRRRHAEGWSSLQIAMELGGVSRTAVIGKIHRLKLNPRKRVLAHLGATARSPRKTAPVVAKPVAIREELPAPAPAPVEPEPALDIPRENFFLPLPGTTPIRLMQLTEATCKWPVDTVYGREGIFCGAPKEHDRKIPYCAVHSRIAINPAPLKRLR